jgi:Zn-dependent peptidase ImmA (M78 family)/DNA-binding XRE family transcriptional regulator
MIQEQRFNSMMVTLAREFRELTQRDLAELLNISQGKLSKVEQDSQSLNEELEEQLSKALNFPISFFYQEGEILPMSLNFRRRAVVAQKLIMPIEARINIYRLNIEALLKASKQNVKANWTLTLKDLEDPIHAARQLRKLWKMSSGSVNNLTDCMEAMGIIIVAFDFGTERVDSRTIITKEGQPIVFINKMMLGDRQRFSLAHELGHLVMHAFTPTSAKQDIGHDANVFAAEFLMPEQDIRKDFKKDITIEFLADLKRQWKVSMQALLYRTSNLGYLSDNQTRYLLQQFNERNIRRREPPELDVPVEKPRFLRDLITRYRTVQKMNVAKMATFLHLAQDEFLRMYVD